MNHRHAFIVALVAAIVTAGTAIGTSFQEEVRKVRKITRVKRPVFTENDWDGIYFEDLIRDGLVGARPAKIESAVANTPNQSDSTAETGDSEGEFTWSQLIADFVIEDEIKNLQKQLEQDVTSPGKFKSEYSKARQSYSVLSMMFAVIREYDGDVRWKRYAAEAQAAFARTAANARVGSQQAYQSAKQRKEDLAEMIRGGNFESNEDIPEVLEWPLVIDRSPLMVRLQESIDRVRPLMSNASTFTDDVELIEHEASLIAVMGEILTREGMEEADEDDYLVHAKAMLDGAKKMITGATNSNYDIASPAFNAVAQSCSQCHEEWR